MNFLVESLKELEWFKSESTKRCSRGRKSHPLTSTGWILQFLRLEQKGSNIESLSYLAHGISVCFVQMP